MQYLYILDLAGTLVFAISGILTAYKQRLDWFGGMVIGFITALGGGTVRDVLIGATPVGWMLDLNYLYVILSAGLLTFLLGRYIMQLRRTLFLFDTIGIGLFTVIGLSKTLDLGLSPVVALLMGTVSAVFGGVLRDTLCNVVPLIFRKEIYATACIAGGICFLLLRMAGLNYYWNTALTVSLIISLRLVAVKWHWSLPMVYIGRDKMEKES